MSETEKYESNIKTCPWLCTNSNFLRSLSNMRSQVLKSESPYTDYRRTSQRGKERNSEVEIIVWYKKRDKSRDIDVRESGNPGSWKERQPPLRSGPESNQCYYPFMTLRFLGSTAFLAFFKRLASRSASAEVMLVNPKSRQTSTFPSTFLVVFVFMFNVSLHLTEAGSTTMTSSTKLTIGLSSIVDGRLELALAPQLWWRCNPQTMEPLLA
ncbi:hypothetical protein FA15DRAFT_654666 [Coprinopsis marcescibilis]|nr:hypothetical protein FA15DRAFT_654666 [Coprinopsis marcescibilis]